MILVNEKIVLMANYLGCCRRLMQYMFPLYFIEVLA